MLSFPLMGKQISTFTTVDDSRNAFSLKGFSSSWAISFLTSSGPSVFQRQYRLSDALWAKSVAIQHLTIIAHCPKDSTGFPRILFACSYSTSPDTSLALRVISQYKPKEDKSPCSIKLAPS